MFLPVDFYTSNLHLLMVKMRKIANTEVGNWEIDVEDGSSRKKTFDM